MAADRSDSFDAHTTDSYGLDAIRAIQAKNPGPEMELSADYTDFVLQLRSCRGTKKVRYRQMAVLAHRQSGTKRSNLRNLCNLRILKVFQVGNEMVNKSGINGLHCSKVHASHGAGWVLQAKCKK